MNLITHGLIFFFKVNDIPCCQGLIHSSNPGMSKGGSGDVLAGLILALLGQGWEPELAARDGVYLHGEAGDRCAGSLGEYGMTPGDLVERLPETLEAHVRSGS